MYGFPVAARMNDHKLGGLKMTEIYPLKVLEARRCHRAVLPPKSLGRISSWPLVTSGGLKSSLADGCVLFHGHIASSSVSPPCVSYKDTRHWIMAHLDNPGCSSHFKILNLITRAPFPPIWSHSPFPWIRIWTYLFGGPPFMPLWQ